MQTAFFDEQRQGFSSHSVNACCLSLPPSGLPLTRLRRRVREMLPCFSGVRTPGEGRTYPTGGLELD